MTFQLSAKSLAKLETVHPYLAGVVKLALLSSDTDFTVIEGARTIEKQREYFAAGKSKTMNSRHLPKVAPATPDIGAVSHAVDLAPYLDADGDGYKELSWEPEHFLPIADAMKSAALALRVRIVWGGDWTWRDMPHFELDRRTYP